MTLAARRVGTIFLALWVFAVASSSVIADALPDSTWVALKPVPRQARSPLFALAADPNHAQTLLAGTSDGSLLRSDDGGGTWKVVHSTHAAIVTIAYDPFITDVALAGTRGSGAFITRDGGSSWTAVSGLSGRTVRVFAFALTLFAAGTDQGVFLSGDGAGWTRSGLGNRSIDALAVLAIHSPVRLVAASDSQPSGGALVLFQSVDAGTSWTQFSPPISGSFAVRLAAGPLPPTGDVRPLIVGTNTGVFASRDNGSTFTPLSGGGMLPSADYTQASFITGHFDHFYLASDGGGSGSGGLWRTGDGGQTFTSLEPPQPSITALAMSSDEEPTIYIATFRPSDHAVQLWAYHDTGGPPHGPPATPVATASGSRAGGQSGGSRLADIMDLPQLPYIGLGLGAVAVILTAIAAHLRSRRR